MDKRADETTRWHGRRDRLRLECRECEVICERVVYPWHCLRSNCQCVYSYGDAEAMYFGCLYKVFAPELDLAAFCESVAGGQGGGDDGVHEPGAGGRSPRTRTAKLKSSDPYGPVRVSRWPRPQCLVRVEQAYDAGSAGGCCNPTFFHHPSGPAEDAMRLRARGVETGPKDDGKPDGRA